MAGISQGRDITVSEANVYVDELVQKLEVH